MEQNTHSTSEVGHAKNVANFEDLISFCRNFGPAYNPSNGLLAVPSMEGVFINAQNTIQTVHAARTLFIVAVNERQLAFEGMETLATRIINALSVSVVDQRIVKDARTILNKIRGIAPTPQTNDNQSGQEIARASSNSQRSYDKLIDHFAAYLEILRQTPAYMPNEADLSTPQLETYLENLRAKNTAVINGYTSYSQAMLERDRALYDAENAIIPLAKMVKKYVRSVFGAASPQYNQVRGIEFRTVRS